MKTTDWTSIRSRLAIGGAAYRPPRRRRKSGHRSIVAPLGATLAAGVAVGVAVVLAKTARERRTQPLPDRDRRLGLQSGERPCDGLQRMALGQIDIAIEQLQRASERSTNACGARKIDADGAATGKTRADAAGASTETTVHETRKALKRLRALLRLLRSELGEGSFARADAAVREIAQRLSGARDAEVMLATLDALVDRHPSKLGRRKGVRRLRRTLLAEHERMERETLRDGAVLAHALAELRSLRASVAAWQLPDRDGSKRVDAGLREIYAQGRKRFRRAKRKRGKDVWAMHRWRKRVKELRYASEMLERRPSKRSKRNGRSARLHELATRADALAEVLGEDHDLAVLAERVRAQATPSKRAHKKSQRIGRASRRALLKLIAERRRKLRKRALRDGERLYKRSSKKFMQRL